MSKIKKWFDKTNKFDFIGYVLLLVFFCVMAIYLYNNMQLLTDSDQSSNLIYAKLLLQEKSLVSKNWYFSTYVDILNMDKIQAFFFLFTDNWKMVHWLTNISIELLLFASFYYVCVKLGVKHIPWISFLLIGSLSYLYYKFAFSFNIYGLYMFLAFLPFGVYVDVLRSQKPRIKYCVFLFVVFMVATSGIRNITTTFAPMVCVSLIMIILMKIGLCQYDSNLSLKLKFLSLLTVLGSAFGYVFNKFYLCATTGFVSTTLGLTRELIKEFPEIFHQIVFNGWFDLLGINRNDFVKIFGILLLIFVVFFCVKTLFKRKELSIQDFYDKLIIVYFVISACAISATFFISSSFTFENRYLLQSFGFLLPVIGILIDKLDYKFTSVFYILLFLCVCYRTNIYVKIEKNAVAHTQELIDIVEVLDEKQVYKGYAKFWNANVLTELSNGKIDVWAFVSEEYLLDLSEEDIEYISHNGLDEDHIYKWLQRKDHLNNTPNEPFFLVMDTYFEDCFNKEEMAKYTVYSADKRFLMIFDNFEQFSTIFLPNEDTALILN